MNSYKALILSLLITTSFSYATTKTSLDTENLNSLAQEIMELTQDDKHQHIRVPKMVPFLKKEGMKDTNKKSKVKKILSALGNLAEQEGTSSACTFCSGILNDVMVNKVEVVDMAQDWVQLRIKKGNTLSYFAKNYYGNANSYKNIYQFNKKTIGKNYTMYIGKTVTLPRIETLEEQNSKQILSCKFCSALLSDASLKKINILKIEKDFILIKINKGDSLSKLANRYYGKSSKYIKIYNANKDKIGQNYLIHVGDILQIPHPNKDD